MKMKTIEKRGSICPKRISAGPKGIVAIRASMGAGDFKSKVGSESRRSLLLKTKGHCLKTNLNQFITIFENGI